MGNNLEKEIDCPLCGYGICELTDRDELLNYKGEDIIVNINYYKCNFCLEQFTTTESDNIWTKKLFNKE
jgi:C4-type Zn-finger protein